MKQNKTDKQKEQLLSMLQIEREHWKNGEIMIAGIDEAGRGPLAGPVVAACVIMPEHPIILGVNDSKKMSEKKRESLYKKILNHCIDYSIGVVGPDVIDEINILNATKEAFVQSLAGLQNKPDHVYTDALEIDSDVPYTSVIKGDMKIYAIAAASIIAKVTRDQMMRAYAEAYPAYGFERHKGYGTKAHYEAIEEHGIVDIHRRSFLKRILCDD